MRRILAIIAIFSFAIFTAGCGANENNNVTKVTNDTPSNAEVDCKKQFKVNPDSGGDRKVCMFRYKDMDCLYSHGNGGGIWCDNTEKVARRLIELAQEE